jgi:hypothetical protein
MFSDDAAAGFSRVRRCRAETFIVDSARRHQIAVVNGPMFLPAVGTTITLGVPHREAVVRSTSVALPDQRELGPHAQPVAIVIVDVDDPHADLRQAA